MFIPSYKEVGPSGKCFGNYDPTSNWCYLCYYANDCWIARYKDRLKLEEYVYVCKICKEEFKSCFSFPTALYFHKLEKKIINNK